MIPSQHSDKVHEERDAISCLVNQQNTSFVLLRITILLGHWVSNQKSECDMFNETGSQGHLLHAPVPHMLLPFFFPFFLFLFAFANDLHLGVLLIFSKKRNNDVESGISERNLDRVSLVSCEEMQNLSFHPS